MRHSLTKPDAEKLVHAFITSRIDYCNSLLAGIPAKTTQRLQYVQNCAARILTKTRKSEHITPILHSLQWLPVTNWINYKVLIMVFNAINHTGPTYLQELLTRQHSHNSRTLRSASSNLLAFPQTKLVTMGDRAFSSLGPRLWNQLPENIRTSASLSVFRKCLETHLFHTAFY